MAFDAFSLSSVSDPLSRACLPSCPGSRCEKRALAPVLTIHGPCHLSFFLAQPHPPRHAHMGSIPDRPWLTGPGRAPAPLFLIYSSLPLIHNMHFLSISCKVIHLLLGQLFHEAFSGHHNLKFSLLCIIIILGFDF